MSRSKLSNRAMLLAMLVVLAVAAGLRLGGLPDPPPGLHYDEAANILMASEIAYEGARPVHINNFEGREIAYFYLSALAMRLVGDGELALRLTAAFCALVAVAATYPIARRWLGGREVGVLAAALLAVSFWNVAHSRQALEIMTVPAVQALALALWVWALRRARWGRAMALAGACAGLTLYTYYAARAFPVVVAAGWAVLLAASADRRLRLRQAVVFALAALLAVTPLAVYFAMHPDQLLGRMGQLAPGAGEGGVSVLEGVRLTAGMFFIAGDPQVRWNLPDRPLFDPLTGALMVIGIAVSVWRAVRPGDAVTRTGYALLLINLVVMSLPSALAVGGLPPSFHRSVGLIPLLFVLPAVGAEAAARALPARWRQWALWGAIAAALGVGGLHTRHLYFDVWSPRADLYFVLEGDLEAAGQWLDREARPDETLFVASKFYQHPTLAASAAVYNRVRWLMAGDVLALPAEDQAALYVFPRSAPAGDWAGLLEAGRLDEIPLAPDGGAAFEAFRFAPGAAPRPDYAADLEAIFGGVVALRGADPGEPVKGGVQATLYWEVLAAPAADMRLTLDLRDAWGLPWGKEYVFVGDARTWQPGEWLVTRVRVRVPPGTPSLDNYVLRVGWVDADSGALVPAVDAQGRYAGTAAAVPGLSTGIYNAPVEALPLGQVALLDVADGVRLLGWNQEVEAARPGDPLFLTLYWQAGPSGARDDVRVRIEAIDADGRALRLWEGAPVHDTFGSRHWLPNQVVADRYARTLPRDMEPGVYAIVMSAGDTEVDLGALTVREVTRVFDAPPVEERVGAVFGGAIRLLGFNLDRREVRPGESFEVELVWQSEGVVEERYTVFVHLYNPDGAIRAQQDRAPVEGTYPTDLWTPGEVVVDRYTLALDADAPPGAYTLGVGLYLQEGGVRLPVADSDWLALAQVRVLP